MALLSCNNKLILNDQSINNCDVLDNNIRILGKLKLKVEFNNCYYIKKTKLLHMQGKILDDLSNHPISDVAIFCNRNETLDTLYITTRDGNFNFFTKLDNKEQTLLFFNLVGYENKNYKLNCLTDR